MAVLAMAPGTLLLDEPYASLDLPGRLRLARVLEGMGQRVVVISHDPGALAGMERVIWLEDGRIRRDGTADAVLEEFGAEMARRGAADADTDIAG
jgi:biotin transport system ATP-binding protein